MTERNYDDIIDLPHHVSKKHPQMSRLNRAAQFAPFAALTGYDACVKEEARLTGSKTELSQEQIMRLNRKVAYLKSHLEDEPTVTVTFFLPDKRKAGGEYVTETGAVYEIDGLEGVIVLTNKKKIFLTDVIDIESELFEWDGFDG